DVLAVYDKTKIAVARARRGDGPTLLEFQTYRHREHCGPEYDNDVGYRTEQEFRDWLKRDPLELFKKHLGDIGVLQEAEIEALKEELKAEIDEAFQFAKDSPFPPPDNAARHVYAGQTGDISA
ncbi:MAG TPA: thiamine pyrophosphate-dependent dehydrogenase E1 component subunit alpha, partial [Rhodospirillales bacterium]|nr:thiamine pyrophosphate-dependent dehydrogenase E1 component subunit alpha [Rhodospirillales bacterium]